MPEYKPGTTWSERRIAELEATVARLTRERDEAIAAADALYNLVTTPVTQADLDAAVAEARRTRGDGAFDGT